MKHLIGILTTAALFAALILSGCDRPSTNNNNMGSNDGTVTQSDRDSQLASGEVEEEVRAYRMENAERFREFNRTTSDIDQQIRNESNEEVKAQHERELEEHKETQRELNRELDNYSASDDNNWDEFKDDFSSRMDDFGDSLNEFFSRSSTASTNN